MPTEVPPAPTATPPVSSDPNVPNPTGSSANAEPSWARSWVKDDGTLDHKAFEKAPDELRPLAKDVERYKTWDDFIKGHRELTSLAGKKGIVDPLPDNATQQQKDERAALLRKVNGVPEKPEGYQLQRPPEVPEGQWDQKYADTIASLAHKHGVSPAALKELAAAELNYTKAQIEANKVAETQWFESQDKLIRDTLAKEGLDFAKGKDLAERAGRKFGVDPANPLMKNASVFTLLTRIGRMMGEDQLVTGDQGGGLNLNINPERAAASAKDIQQNKSNPDYDAYWQPNHARHADVVEKVNSMLLVATKDKPRRTR